MVTFLQETSQKAGLEDLNVEQEPDQAVLQTRPGGAALLAGLRLPQTFHQEGFIIQPRQKRVQHFHNVVRIAEVSGHLFLQPLAEDGLVLY